MSGFVEHCSCALPAVFQPHLCYSNVKSKYACWCIQPGMSPIRIGMVEHKCSWKNSGDAYSTAHRPPATKAGRGGGFVIPGPCYIDAAGGALKNRMPQQGYCAVAATPVFLGSSFFGSDKWYAIYASTGNAHEQCSSALAELTCSSPS